MQIGVVFPQTELGRDVGAVRAYAQAVEELGFAHLLIYDHVLGADPEVHRNWRGPYDIDTTFHEPFVVFGYLAAVTSIELVTGIIIAPQRQTALLAKQAAEVDILTQGRFRLGLGIGWNPVEYHALGQDFHTRGRRLDEQIELLRRLWTTTSVTFDGRFDQVEGAGLCPMPVQQPIPIWVGGSSPGAYRRIGRLADGWFPQIRPGADLDDALAEVAAGAAEVGRDPADIAMEGRMTWRTDDEAKSLRQVGRWRDAGASHLSVDTMYTGLQGVDAHVAALASAAAALDIASV
jgi:probable F420-dependent oxidoreductase